MRATCRLAEVAGFDAAAQRQALQSVLASRIAGIAVAPLDPTDLEPVIRRATEGGVPVVTFESDAEPSSARLAFIGPEEVATGSELGRLLLELLPGGGTYAVLAADPRAPGSRARLAALRTGLAGRPFRELRGSPFATGHEPARAVQRAGEVLEQRELQAVVLLDGWALLEWSRYKAMVGRVRAKRTQLPLVIAFGVLQPALRLVDEGLVAGLVGPRPHQLGTQLLRRLWDAKRDTEGIYPVGFQLITKGNVGLFLRR